MKYSPVKKALIEALRTFVVAFLATLSVQLSTVDLMYPSMWIRAVLVASLTAGVRAVFKYLRDQYGRTDYSRWIYRLPF